MIIETVRPLVKCAPEGAGVRRRRTRAGPLWCVKRRCIAAFTDLSRVRDRAVGRDRTVVDGEPHGRGGSILSMPIDMVIVVAAVRTGACGRSGTCEESGGGETGRG